MNVQQIGKMEKIIEQMSADYCICKQVEARQEELDAALSNSALNKVIRESWQAAGMRNEIITHVLEDVEATEIIGALLRELSGVAARWDMADQIDGARDAA